MDIAVAHKQMVPRMVAEIVGAVAKAGGSENDALTFVGSVVAGVMFAVLPSDPCIDDGIIEEFAARLRERMQQVRLSNTRPFGHA